MVDKIDIDNKVSDAEWAKVERSLRRDRLEFEDKEFEVNLQKEISPRRAIWLSYFLDPDGKTSEGFPTFMHKTNSTIAAGFNCKNRNSFRVLGQKVWNSLQPALDRLFEEAGITEETIKLKLAQLMHAEKTLFFACAGEVKDQRTVPDLETQLAAVKMAAQMKGLLSSKPTLVASNNEGSGVGEYVLPTEARRILGDLFDSEDDIFEPPDAQVTSRIDLTHDKAKRRAAANG